MEYKNIYSKEWTNEILHHILDELPDSLKETCTCSINDDELNSLPNYGFGLASLDIVLKDKYDAFDQNEIIPMVELYKKYRDECNIVMLSQSQMDGTPYYRYCVAYM